MKQNRDNTIRFSLLVTGLVCMVAAWVFSHLMLEATRAEFQVVAMSGCEYTECLDAASELGISSMPPENYFLPLISSLISAAVLISLSLHRRLIIVLLIAIIGTGLGIFFFHSLNLAENVSSNSIRRLCDFEYQCRASAHLLYEEVWAPIPLRNAALSVGALVTTVWIMLLLLFVRTSLARNRR